MLLRKALWARGLRYRVAVKTLPGRPDIVFTKQKVAVFCDGDFWHGRDIERRLQKLGGGHNALYWVAKISTNVARDRRNEAALLEGGWKVLRIWETDILRAPEHAADQVQRSVEQSWLLVAQATTDPSWPRAAL